MARMKKQKKSGKPRSDKTPNLPTPERLLKDSIVVRQNRAQVQDPLRIDKMLKNAIIDEMQHLYGMQIITLWTIANRPFIKAMQYETRTLTRLPDFDLINLTRMSAEDQFHKTISFLRPRDYELISRICFKEQGAIEAGRGMGLPVNSITVYVRAAFDALGEALAKMRDVKRAMEKPAEERASVEQI